MRVLVISAAYPPMRAGEADHTFHLCRHLAERGLDVHVLTTRRRGVTNGLQFEVYPIMRRWAWSDLPRWARFLRRCRPDAILLIYIGWIYDYHPMITFAPTISKALLPGVTFVTQFENAMGALPDRTPVLARVLRKGLLKWVGRKDGDYHFGTLLRDSDRIIVLSQHHRTILSRRFPGVSERSVLIPPPPILRMSPVDSASRRRVREALGLKPGDFLLAYFGYIYPGKGVETLLRGFEIVGRQNEHVHLILIGGIIAMEFPDRPAYADEMRDLARLLGLEGRITWTGEYAWDSDEASSYLRAADVCVFPSDWGVMLNNSTLAAAVGHGLPVIATQGPWLEAPFADQDVLLLCPPKDPEAMAEAIQAVVSDPDLRQHLIEGAGVLANEWFSWENAVSRTVETLTCRSAYRDR